MKYKQAAEIINNLVGYARNASSRISREIFSSWTHMMGNNPFAARKPKEGKAAMVYMTGKFTHVSAVMEMFGKVAEFHSTVGRELNKGGRKKDILLLPTDEPNTVTALMPKLLLTQLDRWEGASLRVASI